MEQQTKKKIKSLFSPAKIIFWVALLLLCFTMPQLNKDAMSETENIVTMLFVDKEDEQFNIAVTVLAPGKDREKTQQVYLGSGVTLSDAVDSIALAVGKEMGFAQCEIMGLGNNICEDGVMQALDYMTRTKKVGRNAVLINFEGDVQDFANAVTDINSNKNLSLDKIINYDKRYILSESSNIETFYIGYFSDIGLGIIPKISLIDEQTENAIQVGGGGSSASGTSSNSGGGGSGSSGAGGGQEKYLLNNGTCVVFKDGKSYLTLTPDIVEKVNIFVNKSQKSSLILEGVSDYIYDNATVVVDVVEKGISISPKFKNGVPTYKADVSLTVSVEEVAEANLTKSTLRRNQDFLTPTLIEKIKEKTKSNMLELVDYCRTNKVDLVEAYKLFYRHKYKQWKTYLSEVGEENFFDGIQFEISVSVNSEF